MRCRPAMQAVAVVFEVLAHVVGITVAAEMALPTGDIRGRYDTVPGFEKTPLAVVNLTAGGHHFADILMTADERICQIPLVRGSGVLLALAAEGVFMGAADSGVVHLHDDGAGRGIGHRKFPQRDDAGTLGDGRPNHAHASTLARAALPMASARSRAACWMPISGATKGSSCRMALVFPLPPAARSPRSSRHQGRP